MIDFDNIEIVPEVSLDMSGEPIVASAANDDTKGGRVAASSLTVSTPANDNSLPLLVADMRLALPMPGTTDDDVYRCVCDQLSRFSENGEWKVRRTADAIVTQCKLGLPLASHGGSVSWEPIIKAAGLHPRDAAVGTEVRRVIDTYGQALVSFPLHISPGWTFTDPVAALYMLRACNVEIGRYGDRISLQWLKEFAGVPVSAARQNRLFKRLLREWRAGGRITFAETQFRPERGERAERGEQVAAVERTLAGFDVSGGGLPASAHRHGAIDMDRIAELSGVDTCVMRYPEVERRVSEMRGRRGVRIPGFNFGSDHLAQLFAEGIFRERRAALSSGVKNPEERVSAFRSAFMHLIDASGCTTEDLASEVFGDDRFGSACSRAAAAFSHSGTRRNFEARSKRWKALHDEFREAETQTGTFAERLTLLMGPRGLSQQQVADACGCSWGTIRNWVRGGNVSVAMMERVGQLEEFFDLPTGELSVLARKGWSGNVDKTVNPYWKEVKHRYKRLLPTEVRFLSRREIKAAVREITPLVRNGSDYAIIGNAGRSEKYRLPDVDLPVVWQEKFAQYISYKTANVVAPMLRAKKGRWREPTTINEKTREIKRFMTFASASCTEDARAGLGLPTDAATLAWLAAPGVFLRYFSWQAGHLSDVKLASGPRGEVFTTRMRHFAWTILSLTHPVTGYLTQLPQMALTLHPVKVTASAGKFQSLMCFALGDDRYIVSPEEVELARSDWKAFIAVAYEAAKQTLEYIDDDVTVVRDTMVNAEGLLHGDEPLGDYLAALAKAERRIRAERHGTFLATELRNLLMCEFSLWTGFRPKNVVGLVYTGDANGEIWKESGVWTVRISYRKFKNWKSCVLFGPENHKQDYRAIIEDDPRLSALLDDWFFVHRPVLDRRGNDMAFLTMAGNPLNSHSWYEACRKFGAKYVVWNPVTREGLFGVVSINPYLHRVIKATDILVNSEASDRVLEAAFGLQTSPAMIQSHYAIFIPERGIAGSRRTHARARAYALDRTA